MSSQHQCLVSGPAALRAELPAPLPSPRASDHSCSLPVSKTIQKRRFTVAVEKDGGLCLSQHPGSRNGKILSLNQPGLCNNNLSQKSNVLTGKVGIGVFL